MSTNNKNKKVFSFYDYFIEKDGNYIYDKYGKHIIAKKK